jgi:beta-glucanase (GH16 family)
MNISKKPLVALLASIGIILSLANASAGKALPKTVISFASLSKATFGDPDVPLTISETAGTTTVTSNTPDVCTLVAPRLVHIVAVGSCKLVANNPGTVDYQPARPVNKSFTISKAANPITISDFSWISMSYPDVVLTTTQVVGTTTLVSTTTRVCTISGNTVHAVKAGKCTIRGTNPGDSNHLSAKTITQSAVIAQTSSVNPPIPTPVGPWTIRQLNFDDTNSSADVGAAQSWVNSGWYHSGLSFRVATLTVSSTTVMRYLVTDSKGNPVPNKLVNLSVGKRNGGSDAKVKVGNLSTDGSDKTPLDQILVTGTTDANGIVSWSITDLDTTARGGLYTQIAAWITDLSVDTIDITNLEFSIPVGGNNGGGTSGTTVQNKSLLWSDEFDGASGSAPNSSNWTPDLGDGCNNPAGCGWGNGEAEAYAACASQADGSGNMIITASTVAGNSSCTSNKTWTSGKFTSYGKKSFGYGYFEARMKMPAGGGTWPAFWALGTNINTVPWPSCGELDIVEYAGNNPFVDTSAAHYLNPGGVHDYKMGAMNNSVALAQGYHNYGMLWLPTEVTFYIDDRIVATIKKSDTGLNNWPFGPNASGVNPKMYIIFNLAMGGSYGGAIDSNLTKSSLTIDYFRYYSANGYGSVPTNN